MDMEVPKVDRGLTEMQPANELKSDMHPMKDDLTESIEPSIGDFLARPRYITRATWATTDVADYVVISKNVMFELCGLTPVANKLKGYRYLRGKLHVRLQMNGSPYHSGRLHASWLHLGGRTLYDSQENYDSMVLPIQYTATYGRVMDACSSEAYELELPFVHMNGMAVTTGDDVYDSLAIRVLNALKYDGTAGPTTSISVTMYAWMTEVELFVPVAQSEKRGVTASPAMISHVTRAVRGYASTFARGLADAALTAAGLGAPAVDVGIQYTKDRSIPVLTSDGCRATGSVTGHTTVEDKLDQFSGVALDEMSMEYVCNKEARYTVLSWAASDDPSMLTYIPVNPGLLAYAAPDGFIFCTPVSYVATPFDYWRGDLVYRVEVVCNKFARGILRLRFKGSTSSLPGFETETGDQHCVLIDLAAGNEGTMRVPYSSNYPWLKTNVVGDTELCYNGYFVVEVIEPLRGVSSVGVNIWVHGERMEFAGLNAKSFTCLLGDQSVLALPQSAALDCYSSLRDICKLPGIRHRLFFDLDSVPAGSNYQTYNIVASNLPEPRSSAYGTKPSTGSAIHNLTSFVETSVAICDYFSAMYLCRRGALRFTMTDVITAGPGPLISPPSFSLRMINTNLFPVAATYPGVEWAEISTVNLHTENLGGALEATVDVPAYFPCEFQNPNGTPTANLGRFVLSINRCISGNTEMMVFVSGADDYSLSCWRYVPAFRTTAYPS